MTSESTRLKQLVEATVAVTESAAYKIMVKGAPIFGCVKEKRRSCACPHEKSTIRQRNKKNDRNNILFFTIEFR